MVITLHSIQLLGHSMLLVVSIMRHMIQQHVAIIKLHKFVEWLEAFQSNSNSKILTPNPIRDQLTLNRVLGLYLQIRLGRHHYHRRRRRHRS